jgi:hypothetical protein
MILEFESEMREPYMGNTLQVVVFVQIENGEIIKLVLESPEGIRYVMKPRSIVDPLPMEGE